LNLRLSFVFFILLLSGGLVAQPKIKTIVENSTSFYKDLNAATFAISTTFKSSIAEAYTIDSFDIVYCKNTKTFMHAGDDMIWKWSKETGNNFFYKPSTREYIDLTNEPGARQSLLDDEKIYPFYNPAKFFAKIHPLLFKVEKKEGFYVVFNKEENYYFDTTTFELKKFDSYYDFKEEGIQVKNWEIKTKLFDSNCSNIINIEKSQALNEFKLVSQFKKPNNKKVFIGQYLSNIPNTKQLFSDNNLWQEMKGKYVLLDFFYQSCMPCIASFPTLKTLHIKYKNNLKIIGVNPFEDEASTMSAFIKRYQLPYTIISGSNGNAIQKTLHPEGGYPYFILLDKTGKIINMSFGYDETFGEKVDKIIAQNP